MSESQISVTIGGQELVADARTFSSGSRGYFTSGKVTIGGKRFQCSVNVVEIGSKPGSAPAAAAPAAKSNGAVKAGLR